MKALLLYLLLTGPLHPGDVVGTHRVSVHTMHKLYKRGLVSESYRDGKLYAWALTLKGEEVAQ